MNITDQPLPQHPAPYPPLHVVRTVEAGPNSRVAELEQRILELLGEIAVIKRDRDQARTEARVSDEIAADAVRDIREAWAANSRLTDERIELKAENLAANRALTEALRELDELRQPWWRRKH